MTQETPAKVFSLLGTAVFSMFFLFAVASTNASFSKTETTLPDAFSPNNVMAFLDNVSSSYSNFVDANVVEPAQDSYAIAKYNLDYIIDEAGPSILAYTGLSGLAEVPTAQPQVAGAFTQAASSQNYQPVGEGFSIDNLYALLIR